MTMKTDHTPMKTPKAINRQRGVVLLFALIALLILMIGAVALVRSFNTSLLNSGNIAFKRDLQNRSEAAVAQVLTKARATGFDTSKAVIANNYSATILDYNDQGIPNALLLSNSDFDSKFAGHAPDITLPDGITIRWVMDRQCNAEGADKLMTASQCIQAADRIRNQSGSSDTFVRAENAAGGQAGAVQIPIVYRLSLRVTGPRQTVAYFQSTFTR